MNTHLQHILEALQQIENLSEEQITGITKSLKTADKEITILEFKLDRTEKVKRTTAILLEETIEELELKRMAIEETNLALQKSLEELKSAQDQLIQQEKLASLGQLTAGIAHEIKNPLNFVNNFSEVSLELIEEVMEEVKAYGLAPQQTITENLKDIESNLIKIHEHGSRANSIVSSMLLHSREGSGKKEPTDLNALIREYVNLSFHGMRAGKNPINVDIKMDLDDTIVDVSLIAEDFSRVILNLCNNAFDAMRSVVKPHFSAMLSIRTQKFGDKIIIEVEDNGPGVPDEIKDKILQPFFTTKKGTEGTGLGLSITNDIVMAHGGELKVENLSNNKTEQSHDTSGSVFSIILPINPRKL
jgi:signal transduction histidine kinase